MKKSEIIFDVQKKLFEEIQKKSPQYVLVDTISNILKISTDSAYRRIRCDNLLSIEETYILCKHFQISFDKLMNIRSTHQFDYSYKPIDLSESNEYCNHLRALSGHFIDRLKKSPDSSIIMSATAIPVFHLISQKELTFFKLYTWSHSIYGYNGSIDDFMKEIETPEIVGCFQDMSKNYEAIPSVEIWTENTINTTLKLLNYYVEIGCFSTKELPLLLCEQVLNILSKLQGWTEKGTKGESTMPFQLYVSEVEMENTYILVKQSGTSNCVVRLFTINSLNVFDKNFCIETEKWLTKLTQRSVLLCGSSEKDRIKFFNSQQQKVHSLIEKIENL